MNDNVDLFLLIGQSNARGVGNAKESVLPNKNCFEYLSSGEIISMRTTLEQSDGCGTIAPSFSNRWNELTGNRVCFIHSAVDGSRIKNWLHDANNYLNYAANKFNDCVKNMSKDYSIGKKYVIWIQGESDAKYGSDIIYYKNRLKEIANTLKQKCSIDKMFVSLTGYWLGDDEYFVRTRKIAVSQELACKECDTLSVGSNRAMTFHEEKLTIDDVHYSQKGLNILGEDLCNNIYKYHTTEKDLIINDTINLDKEREYIRELIALNKKYL